MKLSSLLVLAMFGFVAYLLLHPVSSPIPPAAAPVVSAVQPPEAPLPPAEPARNAPRLQYTGILRQHMQNGDLLVHCGTRLKPDSGPQGDYVLTGDTEDAKLPDDSRFDFYARAAGITTYASVDGGSRTVTRLVFSPTQEGPATEPDPKGWMWKKGTLDARARR